jgi:hypothetical protein
MHQTLIHGSATTRRQLMQLALGWTPGLPIETGLPSTVSERLLQLIGSLQSEKQQTGGGFGLEGTMGFGQIFRFSPVRLTQP